MKKVILAFSGGLDTSYSAKYLSEIQKLEVHTVTVNTGGFSTDELSEIEKKAYSLGAKSHENIDKTSEFYNSCIKYLVFGNVLKNNTYPLSVSAERIVQAMTIAESVNRHKAEFVAHGSTGAGNDQVRFDVIFNILLPRVKIITPIRDNNLSREQEIEFLRSRGVSMDYKSTKYSINKGLWGTSVGGAETLTSDKPLPESAYPGKVEKTGPEKLELGFEKGEIASINGKEFADKVEAIKWLNDYAGKFGIGRDIHVGDTIIGIKGRVGFEAPAAILIIKAHHALEKHVLTKWQLYWKDQLAAWYGNWLHEGQFLDPVMRNIEKFFEDSQIQVSGKVFITLNPYRFTIDGIESKHDLMSSEFGSYGEANKAWTGDDVKGFAKIAANHLIIYNKINKL